MHLISSPEMDKIVSKAKAKSRLRTNEIQLKVAKLQDGEVPVSPVPNQKEGENLWQMAEAPMSADWSASIDLSILVAITFMIVYALSFFDVNYIKPSGRGLLFIVLIASITVGKAIMSGVWMHARWTSEWKLSVITAVAFSIVIFLLLDDPDFVFATPVRQGFNETIASINRAIDSANIPEFPRAPANFIIFRIAATVCGLFYGFLIFTSSSRLAKTTTQAVFISQQLPVWANILLWIDVTLNLLVLFFWFKPTTELIVSGWNLGATELRMIRRVGVFLLLALRCAWVRPAVQMYLAWVYYIIQDLLSMKLPDKGFIIQSRVRSHVHHTYLVASQLLLLPLLHFWLMAMDTWVSDMFLALSLASYVVQYTACMVHHTGALICGDFSTIMSKVIALGSSHSTTTRVTPKAKAKKLK